MKLDKPIKRMTLRELLTHAEKAVQELTEHLRADLQTHATDLREVSRPVRRHSQYPTVVAIHNAVARLEESHEEGKARIQALLKELVHVRGRVRQEVRRSEVLVYGNEAA